jgi:hypothetical protein
MSASRKENDVEGLGMLMLMAMYLGVEATSFTAHAVSYAAQGAVFAADEARRSVVAGPPVTTFEIEFIAPPAALAGEGRMFVCARPPSAVASGEEIRCLNRSYFTSIAGFAEQGSDRRSDVRRFRVPVERAPESLCFDFYDQSEAERGSWFIAGTDSLHAFTASFSALPTVANRRPPLGTFCLSGIPSSGEVTVKSVSCTADARSACRSADIVVVQK